ncbi:hypothetical protein OESDEN_19147, partial [Oesophagostomum dentatum]
MAIFPVVEPPPIPADKRLREHGDSPKTQRERDDVAELNRRISQEYRKEKVLSGRDAEELRAKCVRIAPVAQKV